MDVPYLPYADHVKQLPGTWVNENMKNALEAMSLVLFTHFLGWTPEQVHVLLDEVRADIDNRKIHAYWPV